MYLSRADEKSCDAACGANAAWERPGDDTSNLATPPPESNGAVGETELAAAVALSSDNCAKASKYASSDGNGSAIFRACCCSASEKTPSTADSSRADARGASLCCRGVEISLETGLRSIEWAEGGAGGVKEGTGGACIDIFSVSTAADTNATAAAAGLSALADCPSAVFVAASGAAFAGCSASFDEASSALLTMCEDVMGSLEGKAFCFLR